MLDVGTANRRGSFWSEGQGIAAEVFEGVHLLLDDVGFIADAAPEESGVLENRCIDLLVAELARGVDRGCSDGVPEDLVVGKDVGDAARSTIVSLFSHSH